MTLLFPGLRVLQINERGVICRLGRFERVVEPGLIFYIPFIDLVKVVNLDRTIPGWRGISEERLKEYVEFLVLKYHPKIPTNLSVSDIQRDMGSKERMTTLEE